MIPDKIIPAIIRQAMSKISEIVLKVAGNVTTKKILRPVHPGVAKLMRQRSVATLIIVRIKISIIRSLTGRILTRTV